MAISPIFSRLAQWISSVLYPRLCPICGERVEGETDYHRPRYICKHCIETLPRTEQAAERGNSTEDIFHHHPQFTTGAAFLFYTKDDTIRTVVHTFKYRRQPEIAYQLAHTAATDFLQSDFFDEIDYIILVPLHKKRFRSRGYNQSEYIAQALSDVTGIPMDTSHLTRERNNPQQALKSGTEREQNVEGIFAVNHPEELYRKHILLVDDVLTTGSTLLSAITTLEVCKGAKFSVFVLAKAR